MIASLIAGVLFPVETYAQRDTVSLNREWNFSRTEGGTAEVVNLPHDYLISQPWIAPSADEKADNSDAGANIKSRLSARGFKELTNGYYKKTIIPDPSWKGKCIVINFGGIMLVGDVYLNGERIGGTDYGYVGFECDVTDKLKFGQENLLEVKSYTQGPKNSRWYTGGGLYRDVDIIVTDKNTHFERHPMYITTKDNKDVNIIANFTFKDQVEAVKVGVRILDAEGKTVAEEFPELKYYRSWRTHEYQLPAIHLAHPHLWDIDTPYLYTAELTLYRKDGSIADKVSEKFGVRTIEFGPSFGFKLNGRKVLVKGNANHHTLGALGAAAFPRAIEKRIQLLKSFGFNAIRCSHNPYSEDLYKLCDKYGMLVVDELYDKWNKQYAGGRKEWNQLWQYDVSEWIQRDRNHPSVILWSLGNELQQNADMDYNDWGVTNYELMKTLIHRYDNTRLTTVAMHPRYRSLDGNDKPAPLAVATEVNSYNYRYMYFPGDSKLYPEKIFFQSEASTAAMGPNYFEMNLDSVIGLSYWGSIDYVGESNGWPKKGWDNGSFYLDLTPKPNAYFQKAMFSDEPVVHIGVIDADLKGNEWNGITVGSALMSEDWNRKEASSVNVNIYTNCEEIELIQNGKSLGRRKNSMDPKKRDRIRWDGIKYTSGSLEAIGYNNGKAVARHKIGTTGKAVALKLETDNNNWKADGEDLQHVRVYAVDKQGRKVYAANQEVTFNVEGDASVQAVSNSDITSDENFAGNRIKLFQGSALGILRAGVKGGKVTLTVSAPGYKTIKKTLNIKQKE